MSESANKPLTHTSPMSEPEPAQTPEKDGPTETASGFNEARFRKSLEYVRRETLMLLLVDLAKAAIADDARVRQIITLVDDTPLAPMEIKLALIERIRALAPNSNSQGER